MTDREPITPDVSSPQPYQGDIATPVREDGDARSPAASPAYQNGATTPRPAATEPAPAKVEQPAANKRGNTFVPAPGSPDSFKRKYCCCYMTKKSFIITLITSIVLFLLVAFLIVWFPVIDAIFQMFSNQVTLGVNSMDIMKIDDDGFDTIMSLHFTHEGKFHAVVEPTQGDLLWEGKKFGTIDMPEVTVEKHRLKWDVSNFPARVNVTDKEQFGKMSVALITQESIDMRLESKITPHSLGLTRSGIKFDRTFKMEGFNQFSTPPPVINLLDMYDCPKDGYNISINTTMSNPGTIGLDGIGQLNLTMHYEDKYIGYALTNGSIGIPRGESELILSQVVPPTTQTFSALTDLVHSVLDGGNQTFYITADSPFATEYSLFTQAMAALNITTPYSAGLQHISFEGSCSDIITLITKLG